MTDHLPDRGFSPEGRAGALVEALPYIQRFRDAIVVVKFGGNATFRERNQLSERDHRVVEVDDAPRLHRVDEPMRVVDHDLHVGLDAATVEGWPDQTVHALPVGALQRQEAIPQELLPQTTCNLRLDEDVLIRMEQEQEVVTFLKGLLQVQI